MNLRVNASIGLAEYMPAETMKELLSRADAAMYERKADSRGNGGGSRRLADGVVAALGWCGSGRGRRAGGVSF